MRSLAIIGAGPKAAAIAARAAVLRAMLGKSAVPELLVFDASGVGAAWSGDAGHSSGFLTLCTPGEKDVGFPYDETAPFPPFPDAIAPALYARFSWGAYLVAQGKLGDWVDRERDHPTHRTFAHYLAWVFDQAGQDVLIDRVVRIVPQATGWQIHMSGRALNPVDAVVLTGSGEPRTVAGGSDDLVLDASTFWPERHRFLTKRHLEVAVAGDGGAAGTIVSWLADRFAETDSRIWSISPMGTIFPRGDGHAERRWFSDPSDWRTLDVAQRRKLLERTEAGVVSMRNKRTIDRSERVSYLAGRVMGAQRQMSQLELTLDYGGHHTPLTVDYLVSAIGFDTWSLLNLVDEQKTRGLLGTGGLAPAQLQVERDRVEFAMHPDLSLPSSLGYPSGLHVPSLGGLCYGPGMGNLGCLGLMASRVLDGYLS